MNIFLISELINKDGTPIGGNVKINSNNDYSASKLTTDDYIDSTIQGLSFYNNFGRTAYLGEDDEEDVKLPKKDKEKIKPKKARIKRKKSKIKESGENKMRSLIEDIFTKKDFDREFVEKGVKDLRLNGIQDLESIKDTNPILIRKVSALKDIIEKNSASGEEKAIILNHLLSIDMTDVPVEYKEELKKKLG